MTFSAIDHIGIENVSYKYGETSDSFKQGETNEYSISVPVSMFNDNEIVIEATDFAGNVSNGRVLGDSTSKVDDSKVSKITVRAGIWRYVPLLLAVAAVLGVGIFFIVRRLRGDDAEML